jgi:hypothetical protein
MLHRQRLQAGLLDWASPFGTGLSAALKLRLAPDLHPSGIHP